jgi:hypothetical protein
MLIVDVHDGHHHRHHHRRHHGRRYVIFLTANRRSHLANVIVTVGHTVSFTLVYLDQNGNPMLVTPVPDAPPTWTDTTPATGTLTPSGNTASELALAVGADTVNVSLAVGGATFTGTIDIAVQGVPQVLTKVALAATVA